MPMMSWSMLRFSTLMSKHLKSFMTVHIPPAGRITPAVEAALCLDMCHAAAMCYVRPMNTPHEPNPTHEPSARKVFLEALAAAVLSVALTGCGTTPYDIAMSDRQHAEDEQACRDSGFKSGTNQFEKCMQDRHLARMRLTPSDSVSPR
jgi:predicted small lipoprotein YifL